MNIYEPNSGQNMPPGVTDIPDTSGAEQRCCAFCESSLDVAREYVLCLYDVEKIVESVREDSELPLDISARRLAACLRDGLLGKYDIYDRAVKCERYVEF